MAFPGGPLSEASAVPDRLQPVAGRLCATIGVGGQPVTSAARKYGAWPTRIRVSDYSWEQTGDLNRLTIVAAVANRDRRRGEHCRETGLAAPTPGSDSDQVQACWSWTGVDVSNFWPATPPYEPLASQCLAARRGASDPDAYLIVLVQLAWTGLTGSVGLDGASGITLGRSDTSAAAPVLAADSSGHIGIGLPRLGELCGQSLECAKQYL